MIGFFVAVAMMDYLYAYPKRQISEPSITYYRLLKYGDANIF
jgi:hypothetical protein